ncbi:MAG TPA: nucleotidyltransferase domain-containing protein [Candidatus Angelobacter sp.]|nr:nucleotidyltransferase domain-containing protein [Candidatus Angelobacter sp.]
MSTLSSSLTAALFGAARRGVLALLFGHPEESYYLREIARTAGLGLGAVQRELQRLSDAGILRRTIRGHQVYFQANQQSPIFAELKGLMTKTAGLAEVLHTALIPLAKKIRMAFIYGSFAKGEERSESDVDIAIVGKVEFDGIVSALSGAQQKLAREINPTVYSPSEFQSKLRSGHHFLTAVVRGPKIFLIGDEIELARLGGKRMAHRAQEQRRGNS